MRQFVFSAAIGVASARPVPHENGQCLLEREPSLISQNLSMEFSGGCSVVL